MGHQKAFTSKGRMISKQPHLKNTPCGTLKIKTKSHMDFCSHRIDTWQGRYSCSGKRGLQWCIGGFVMSCTSCFLVQSWGFWKFFLICSMFERSVGQMKESRKLCFYWVFNVRQYVYAGTYKVIYVLCSFLLELDNGDSRVCFWICMFWNCLKIYRSTYVPCDGGYKGIVCFFFWGDGEKEKRRKGDIPTMGHIALSTMYPLVYR